MGYARTVWRYEVTTMIIRTAMATEIGSTNVAAAALASRSTRRISSDA
jgi:hypothetical protein